MGKGETDMFKAHLVRCVGKSPNGSEMRKIGKRLKELVLKGVYNDELANLWRKIVAYENGTKEIAMFLKYSNCNKTRNVVSIGSGIGVFESFLAKNVFSKGKVYCVDFSKSMSKQAESIRKGLNLENMKIIVASAKRVPIKSYSADILLYRRTGLSIGKLWPSVLKEARRLIKPEEDSRLIYTVRARSVGGIGNIKKTLRGAGFDFIKLDFFFERDQTKIAMVIARPLI